MSLLGGSHAEGSSESANAKYDVAKMSDADFVTLFDGSSSHDDSLTDSERNKIWAELYKASGCNTDAKARLQLRAAVYVYGAVNGVSRAGNYAGESKVGDVILRASIIPQVVGPFRMRKFFRSNMVESYHVLKRSPILQKDGRFIAKAARKGIAPDCAFAMADWLDDCPLFTFAEADAHMKSFTTSVDRAQRGRGGATLEDVERRGLDRSLQVQGPSIAEGRGTTFDL